MQSKIIEALKNNRESNSETLRDNLLFLDYEGVIDTSCSRNLQHFDPICIANINDLWEYESRNLKIVLTSSLKRNMHYHSLLYLSGLNESIPVIGKTRSLGYRSDEILDYIRHHDTYIGKCIILDDLNDARFKNDLSGFLVTTNPSKGFDGEKLDEAKALLDFQRFGIK